MQSSVLPSSLRMQGIVFRRIYRKTRQRNATSEQRTRHVSTSRANTRKTLVQRERKNNSHTQKKKTGTLPKLWSRKGSRTEKTHYYLPSSPCFGSWTHALPSTRLKKESCVSLNRCTARCITASLAIAASLGRRSCITSFFFSCVPLPLLTRSATGSPSTTASSLPAGPPTTPSRRSFAAALRRALKP